MKKYCVFLNPANGALVLISQNNVDYLFYEERHELLKNGNRTECITFLNDYREENYIPEDEFIFSEVK